MNDTGHAPSRACHLNGCRRPECKQADYRYMSRLRLDLARGKSRRTDATQVIVHAERLAANGWSRAQIAHAASLGNRTVDRLFTGCQKVSVITARAILSVRIGPPPEGPREVDATGSRRRLQALVAIGYPITHLAPRIGLHHAALSHIARGDVAHVRATTADVIAHQYRQLIRIPGTSDQARVDARRKGWHGPLAWDDIDNPNVQPDVSEEPGVEVTEKRPEVEHLARFGIPAEEIEARTGACHSYVKQVISQLYTGRTVRRTKPTPDPAPLDLGNARHGRSGYTLGCRCRTCRNGAAEAARERRARQMEAA